MSRICIVHDDVLSFLLETSTDVTARIQLEDKKKTVKRGALWYEEALPAETILVGQVIAVPMKTTNTGEVFGTITDITSSTLQFGGNATVGRGLCRARII